MPEQIDFSRKIPLASNRMGRKSDAHPVVLIIAINVFELQFEDVMIFIIKRWDIVIDVSVVV